jgi:hypothetical protein
MLCETRCRPSSLNYYVLKLCSLNKKTEERMERYSITNHVYTNLKKEN